MRRTTLAASVDSRNGQAFSQLRKKPSPLPETGNPAAMHCRSCSARVSIRSLLKMQCPNLFSIGRSAATYSKPGTANLFSMSANSGRVTPPPLNTHLCLPASRATGSPPKTVTTFWAWAISHVNSPAHWSPSLFYTGGIRIRYTTVGTAASYNT